jgi:hypothetical protein
LKNPLELYDEFEPTYSLIKYSYNLFDKYITKKHKERVEIFHRQILDGNASEEKIKYEQEYIKANPHDYFTLLKYTVEDDEKEKASIYSNIYSYLRSNQNIERGEKYRLIHTASNLPYSAIELLPRIHIYKNYHTKKVSLKTYLNNLEKNNLYALNHLERNALITVSSGLITEDMEQFSFNETIFNNTIKAFFSTKELDAKKYNIELWENKNALIVTDDAFGEGYDVDKIKPILNELSIPSEAHKFTTELKETFSHFIFNMDNNSNQGINDIEKMNKNNKIIKISFKIQSAKTDVLNLNDENDIQKFKEQFSD